MSSRGICSRTGLPLMRLDVHRLGLPGLSSYRASLEAHWRPMFLDKMHYMSDEQWLNMFANKFALWLANERSILHPDSPTLLEVLDSKGLFSVIHQLQLDKKRSSK